MNKKLLLLNIFGSLSASESSLVESYDDVSILSILEGLPTPPYSSLKKKSLDLGEASSISIEDLKKVARNELVLKMDEVEYLKKMEDFTVSFLNDSDLLVSDDYSDLFRSSIKQAQFDMHILADKYKKLKSL